MSAVDDFDEVVKQYHLALDEIMKGNPEGYKKLYSRRDDVALANPFGPPGRGWNEVAPTLERAVSHYRQGEATGYENIAKYVTAELAYIVEVERMQTKVGGREVFRPEEGTWKIVHRHADPITTPQPAESVLQEQSYRLSEPPHPTSEKWLSTSFAG